ncbi:glycosyltransferase [Synechococcus elongatus IITB4]|uniref:glycosyltransferase n=1 Tax=Synechococcus elongatus TaxID=32046 RepID=UPI0030CB7A0A
MRVLHILNGLHAAGIEALALQLIRHAPPGVENLLLNTDRSQQAIAPAIQQLQQQGHLSSFREWSRCDGLHLAWRSFRFCCQQRPTALLIYPCNRPMLWLALGARLAGVRRSAVAVQNTAPLQPSEHRVWQRLLIWFQRLGVVAVPCTNAIASSLQPLPKGLRLGAVIPNGCDTQAISQEASISRQQRPPGDRQRIIMVARLDPIKDQATLLHAFAAIAPRHPDWDLWLVGDGCDRDRLESLAQSLGLDPATIFLGRSSDIPTLLGKADLFAFSTTDAEGFGIALIEAMAAGLPIVASDVPACREVLLEGQAGLLVPPGDRFAWQQTLDRLLSNPADRQHWAQKAQAIAPTYDIQHTAQQWYQRLQA